MPYDDNNDDPNWLWCICPWLADEDKFITYCDCCHEWCGKYHAVFQHFKEMSCQAQSILQIT